MESVFSEARSQLRALSKRGDRLLEPDAESLEVARVTAKVLYDAAKEAEGQRSRDRKEAMQELVVEGFDHEQVWAGLELQNNALLPEWQRDIQKLLNMPSQRLDLLGGDPVFNGGLPGSRKRKEVSEDEEEDDEEEDALEEMQMDRRVRFDEDEEEGDEEEAEDEEGEEDEDEEDSDLSEIDGLQSDDDEEDDKDSIFDDPDFQHMSDSDGDDLPLFENAHSEDEDGAASEDEAERERRDQERERKAAELESKTDDYMANAMKSLRKKQKGSEVDDQFFKLDEMEKFLESEDLAEERRRRREEKGLDEQDDEDDPDTIDYFAADGSDGEEDEDEDRAMHADYFLGDQALAKKQRSGEDEDEDDEDEDEDEEGEEEDGEDSLNASQNRAPALRNLLADSDDEDDDSEKDLGEVKSTHEERQLRLKKKISEMESEAVSEEKPWQLRGEIAGPARPENSLLQEHLDYDTVAKQAPVITEEVSKRLEDIILQRVKDSAYDDVVRKVKPAEDPYEYKKRLVLDQEKSKLSLAQVYEQEFLAQQGKLEQEGKEVSLLDREESETPKEVEQIRKDMNMLFAKLDTLTHFHYTPKNLNAEVKIVKNMPSIAMEEVAPVAASDATLLAPQEIADAKRGEALGHGERSETDMKRERRKKKLHQKKKAAVEAKDPAAKLKEDKTTSKMKEDAQKSKSVKSSSAFFDKLQQETTEAVHAKGKKAAGLKTGAGKKREKGLKARSLKL